MCVRDRNRGGGGGGEREGERGVYEFKRGGITPALTDIDFCWI